MAAMHLTAKQFLKDLAFTLNWPGSTFGTILIGPDGTEYPEEDSSTPPYTLVANHALAGKWRYRVHDQKSGDKEPWQMVIGQITPSAGSTSPMAHDARGGAPGRRHSRGSTDTAGDRPGSVELGLRGGPDVFDGIGRVWLFFL